MPWISAPLDAAVNVRLGQFIELVHNRSADAIVKAYFTISTGLSSRMNEIWMLHALNANAADPNGEIIKRGDGGGYSWLQEHLSNYTAGYHTILNGPGGSGPGGLIDGAVEVWGWSRLQNWSDSPHRLTRNWIVLELKRLRCVAGMWRRCPFLRGISALTVSTSCVDPLCLAAAATTTHATVLLHRTGNRME